MRNIFTVPAAVLACFALLSCSSIPQDKAIAKIGNPSLFVSDAEFLAAIKPETSRDKKSITTDLQQAADTRRLAETARILFAGAGTSIQKDLANNEEARLAQVYAYFYLRANMGFTNKALLDYYEKNKTRYADSSFMPFVNLREKIAADLFLEKNPQLATLVNDSNKTAIIDSCRRAMLGSETDRLKKLYNVEIVAIEPPGA